MWNLEGMTIRANYLGDIPVAGKVTLSRVKYGGGISHHITLAEGFTALGGKIKRDAGEGIIVAHEDVLEVRD